MFSIKGFVVIFVSLFTFFLISLMFARISSNDSKQLRFYLTNSYLSFRKITIWALSFEMDYKKSKTIKANLSIFLNQDDNIHRSSAKNHLKFKNPHRYRAFSFLLPLKMASFSNLRLQNRKERPNLFLNNSDMAKTAKHGDFCE